MGTLSQLHSGIGYISLETSVSQSYSQSDAYDGWIIAGQSNNLSGPYVLPVDRIRNNRIVAIRISTTTPILLAAEPLESDGTDVSLIGFAKSFSETLISVAPSQINNRKILLYRHAIGGTGFKSTDVSNWNPGNIHSIYDVMVANIVALNALYPAIYWRGMLWHQGEDDSGFFTSGEYAAVIDDFILSLRTDLSIPDLPFVAGGLSPSFASYDDETARMALIPSRDAFTGFMDPRAGGQSNYGGDTTTGMVDSGGLIHFTADNQRTNIGPRYVKGWLASLNNNNPGGSPAAATVSATIAGVSISPQDEYVIPSFTPPNNGGAVISGYEARISIDAGSTWVTQPYRWCGTGRKLTGLTNAVEYTAQFRALNSVGAGTWSASSTFTPGIDFEAEADTLFARMTPTPSYAWKEIVNDLILGLKGDGVWAKLDCLQVQAVDYAQWALLDWVNSSRTATETASPTFTARQGYSFPTTTARVSVGFNPYDGGTYGYLATNSHYGVYSRTSGQGNNYDVGQSNQAVLCARTTGDLVSYRLGQSSTLGTAANTDGSGFYVVERRPGSNTTERLFKNGASLGTHVQGSAAGVSESFILGGRSVAPTLNSGRTIALFCAGSNLGDADGADLAARVATFVAAVAALPP